MTPNNHLLKPPEQKKETFSPVVTDSLETPKKLEINNLRFSKRQKAQPKP